MATRTEPTKEYEQYILNLNVDDSVVPGALVLGIKAKDNSGGYTPLTSTAVSGDQALDVNVVKTVGGGSGGTSSADDDNFTAGTTLGTPAMGVYESSETNVTDGDMGIVGITQDRHLKVNVADALPTGANVIGKIDINSVTPDLMLGTDFSDVFGTASLISATPAVKVEEQGTVTVTGSVTIQEPLSVDDNGGSLTVDNAGLTELAAAINASKMDVNIAADAVGLATSSNQSTLITELQVNNGAMAMQVDDAGGGVTYQGWAEPGTATSAASWRIRKITATGADYSILFADGNRNFDNIWDNRASLLYS